jgi:hypothetical protein
MKILGILAMLPFVFAFFCIIGSMSEYERDSSLSNLFFAGVMITVCFLLVFGSIGLVIYGFLWGLTQFSPISI